MSRSRTTGPRMRAGLLGLALACPAALNAQYLTPPPPAAYALEGVTLVRSDGGRSENVTLVIRGPFIEAIGPDVSIPADAKRLEGGSLMVYPGIVDGSGEVEYELPEVEIEPDEVQSWAPRRDVQSFQPHRRVVDYLMVTDSSLAALREQGVVAAAVHPDGGLMPGRGTVVVARQNFQTPQQLVADPALGPLMSFDGGSIRVYPATLFGVIAFMRQSFEDAERAERVQAEFASDPSGMVAPGWDPDYEVLRQVLDGTVPAYFAVNSAGDIRRALDLAAEYDFRAVILGGAEAWKVADLLAERDVPVLVSLDFPEPERWDPDEEPQEPLDAATLAEKQRLEDLYANAGRLAEAGVEFALTSGGGETDIREGVRKAIEYGLSEEAALAAVTATPAEHYGIPHVTRIEEGMPATFVVTDGPLFGEDARVLYTFVEGALERGPEEEEEEVEDEEGEPVSLAGTWEVRLAIGHEVMTGEMEFTQDGSAFEGSLQGPFGEAQITDGTISDQDVSFTLETDGESFDLSGTLSEDGNEMSAGGSTPSGQVNFQAVRTGGPGGGR